MLQWLCVWGAYVNLCRPSLIRPWPLVPDKQPKFVPKTKRTYSQPKGLLGGECTFSARDFKSTRSRLQETVKDAGRILALHPKL